VKPEPPAEPGSPGAKGTEAPAHLSLRAVSALEVASVVVSVLITVWVIVPLHPHNRWLAAVPGALALALMINSHRVRGEKPRELGFTTRHFGRAWRLLAGPMIVAGAVILGIGYQAGSLRFGARFWENLATYPVWGLAQQYILQAFIYRRLRFVLVNERALASEQWLRAHLAIILAALLFALVHAPNLGLMVLTLVAGLVWTWVYERAPNLFALGISHGLMSVVAVAALPSWLLPSLSVGYKHLMYQKF
jgi:membrane protease YdiL (CAAX protease family)